VQNEIILQTFSFSHFRLLTNLKNFYQILISWNIYH